ncbi:hypothetical protein METBIDRAFT_101873 [Metschnikowia bicuspidata var. bicuspidata NRRL YB-4993]|uniref:Uncharacterized protein n=1 Tax=Metschnikowia bicuspidata var. bicuspidata NRRL YB-4993 TaxID=869754 RepID=A0A1A0HH83_9ASCO|nr:hypothetical protein METBIDRAFT_101873 [Metschnikowia bicuspidata var. bicuspidata NRRL YB-4993]OBA23198.1 hypothetical protein METBIDRAFT_101873 [Metschnikowia bicuspidata var. bicuspidata NRRL YB-4993]
MESNEDQMEINLKPIGKQKDNRRRSKGNQKKIKRKSNGHKRKSNGTQMETKRKSEGIKRN